MDLFICCVAIRMDLFIHIHIIYKTRKTTNDCIYIYNYWFFFLFLHSFMELFVYKNVVRIFLNFTFVE